MVKKLESLINEVQAQAPGKEILYAKQTDSQHILIVLAKWQDQYVTWMYNRHFCSLNWGRYFSNDEFSQALKDYQKRNY